MLNLKEIAKNETTISSVMKDRENVKLIDLISAYPDGVHVNKVDLVDGQKGEYVVFTFNEDDTRFANGGYVMSKIVKGWLKAADGDLNVINEALTSSPIMMRFTRGTTKNGNNITRIEVL